MKTPKITLLFCLCFLATALFAQGASRKITLCGKQLTAASHVIITPAKATPSEAFAAEELRDHLAKMTGETLAIVSEGTQDGRSPIFIGKCASLPVQVDWRKLGLEGIHIETAGNALVLVGGQRGVLYAVYTFLEDYLDCRWFATDCIVIPNSGEKRIDSIRKVYVPPLEYRNTDYLCHRAPEFAVRNKYNGYSVKAFHPKWGGIVKYQGFVHTFNSLVPPEKYGKEHPEYYSEINGVRVTDHSQLCLTNPDVLRIATNQVHEWMRSTPDATIFSVSQNDWRNYCTCKACTAIAEREESQMGPLLEFVNAIARAVRDEFPDKIVDTLAYQYTRKPPKYLKPEPNVAIRLCSIECCFAHPLESCEFNKTFVSDIIGWSKICNRLHIWDYVINYHHNIQPFPNLRVLRPNIQFFIRHGVTGIYEEANYYSYGSELAELRSYMMGKFLWDPDYDDKKALNEFVQAYYGAAAPSILSYLELVHRQVCDVQKTHLTIFLPTFRYLNNPAMLEEAKKLFDQAEAAVAGDETLSFRVKLARLPIIYTEVTLSKNAMKFENGLLVNQKGNLSPLVDEFNAVATKAGMTRVAESRNATLENWVRTNKVGMKPLEVKTIENPFIRLDIIPALGGRIWRAYDLVAKRDFVKFSGDNQTGYRPEEHGIEGYASSAYRGPGAIDPFTVLKAGRDFLEMECTFKDGVILTRKIELLPGKAEFKITQSITSDKPVKGRATRLHPSFVVPDTNQAELYAKTLLKWKHWELARPNAPQGEHELWFKGIGIEDRIHGAWAILDKTTNTVLLNTFTDSTDFCYLNWNGKDRRINLEQWGKTVDLEPGKTSTIETTYELLPLSRAPWK
ncbi:MAG: DUF4838 domain-containing protein [Victivallales bacterium]|nr:DUF4838 domain-containing protein [Victivallales bacterium]